MGEASDHLVINSLNYPLDLSDEFCSWNKVPLDYPMLKKLFGAKNMLSGQYSGALVRHFFYRCRIIWSLTKSASSCFVFWSLLSVPNSVFDDLVFFGKLMKFFTRISKSLPHLIKFWASEYPDTVRSSGHSQKSASWCFVFWSLLSAPNSDFDDLVLFGKLIKFYTRIFRSPYR